MKFFSVTPFQKAKRIVSENLPESCGSEILELEKAVGRISAGAVFSNEEYPEYNRSTVDGYAVRASEVYGATESVPSLLRCVGKVKMGCLPNVTLAKGETVFVPTGGALPENADAMVMVEYTETFGEDVAFYRPVTVGENVIVRGEDVSAGEQILSENQTVTPMKCGMLAALGISAVEVKKPLRAAIISTGDELVGIDEKTLIGEIRDVNSTINRVFLQNGGFEIVYSVIIKDGFDLLDKAFSEAVDVADVVLISGGSSIGARDFTEQVLEKRAEILVKGVALKPGKPTLIARSGKKLVLGLPGHPMACLLTLKLLLLDVVREKRGGTAPFVCAKTATNFPSCPGRTTVQPVRLEEKNGAYFAVPLFYKSGFVGLLAESDGYVLVPPEAEGVGKGEDVSVYLLN